MLGYYAEAVDEVVFWDEGGPASEDNPDFYPFYQFTDDYADGTLLVEWNLLNWVEMWGEFDGLG